MKLLQNKKDIMRKRLLFLLALGMTAIGCDVKLSPPDSSNGKLAAPTETRVPAPSRSEYLAGGSGEFALESFKGRPLMLSIQGIGTPYLSDEIGSLNHLHEEWAPKGLAVVAVLAGQTPDEDLPALVASLAPAMPVASGTPELFKALGGIRALPTTVLLDATGSVRKQYAGAPNKPDLEADLAALVAAP